MCPTAYDANVPVTASNVDASILPSASSDALAEIDAVAEPEPLSDAVNSASAHCSANDADPVPEVMRLPTASATNASNAMAVIGAPIVPDAVAAIDITA